MRFVVVFFTVPSIRLPSSSSLSSPQWVRRVFAPFAPFAVWGGGVDFVHVQLRLRRGRGKGGRTKLSQCVCCSCRAVHVQGAASGDCKFCLAHSKHTHTQRDAHTHTHTEMQRRRDTHSKKQTNKQTNMERSQVKTAQVQPARPTV